MTPVLNQTITYGELLDWKLHWVYCDLINLSHEIENFHFNNTLSPIEEFAERAQNIINKVMIVELHQVEVMSGVDMYKFRDEVSKLESYSKVKEIHQVISNNLNYKLSNYRNSINIKIENLLKTRLT